MADVEHPETTLANVTASFNEQAKTYDARTGGVTRMVAAHLVNRTAASLPPQAVVLDSACGTGAITAHLLDARSDVHIDAVDGAEGMISIMHGLTAENPSWAGHVTAAVMDGQSLNFPDARFDASYTNFGIFFYPDPDAGAREIYRTLKPGGVALVTAWKSIAILDVLEGVQAILKPAQKLGEMVVLEKFKKRETLESVMKAGGFHEVRMEEADALLWGATIEELCGSLAENYKSFAGDIWTADEKSRVFGAVMEYFKGEESQKLREKPGLGGVGYPCVAWIATATK